MSTLAVDDLEIIFPTDKLLVSFRKYIHSLHRLSTDGTAVVGSHDERKIRPLPSGW